jgi:hypothetical protein
MTQSLLVYNLLQLFSYQNFDNQWLSCVRRSQIQFAKVGKQKIYHNAQILALIPQLQISHQSPTHKSANFYDLSAKFVGSPVC